MRRRRARASHITGGAAATQTPTKKLRRRRIHSNFTASASTADSHRETRRPSSTRSRAPRLQLDDSNDTYTARGSTTVLSEKQRHDPDHGNSCGGERVVYQQR